VLDRHLKSYILPPVIFLHPLTPSNTLLPVGTPPPPISIAPSHRALCQCLIVRARIFTMIQSTLCYFNAFSVQLHLAINDRHTIVSLFSVFSPIATDQQYLLYISQKRLFCRRLSVYCVTKERICHFYPYFGSVESQENH